jgi:hypothetical protein
LGISLPIVQPDMLALDGGAAPAAAGANASPSAQSAAMKSLITRLRYGVRINRVKPATLLEGYHGNWLDHGAQAAANGCDKDIVTLGAVQERRRGRRGYASVAATT